MGRSRQSRANRPGAVRRWWVGLEPKRRRRIGGRVLGMLVVAAMLGGSAYGLTRLKAHVYELPEYQAQTVEVRLLDRPSWLSERWVESMLWPLTHGDPPHPLDDNVAERVVGVIEESGWVRRVVRAERFSGGRVDVRCEYRMPLAVVQQGTRFFLVDEEGVRLPGEYDAPGEFLMIQGVTGDVPEPGVAWAGKDLDAGIKLALLLRGEPFARQVGAISVHNYGGRERAAEAHLKLQTLPDAQGPGRSGTILWGSCPGEEIEEPTAADKVRVLRANYSQCGRIDAGAPWIDVSILRGTYSRPAGGGSVEMADARGRG